VGATGETTMYWTVKFNGDPNETLETEELEQQFLIKWKGWSHINNTWESEKSIGKSHLYVVLRDFYLTYCVTGVYRYGTFPNYFFVRYRTYSTRRLNLYTQKVPTVPHFKIIGGTVCTCM
jgi:hypothetical protein